MVYEILQSSTQSPLLFFLVQTADHITGLTGASPTVTLSKAGASFGSPAGAVTEVGSGWYKVAGNATDTGTLGPLALHATATSGDPFDAVVANIVAYNPQSATVLLSSGTGTGQLDFTSGVVKANTVQLLGTAWLTPGVAGTPDVNIKKVNSITVTGSGTAAVPWGP